MQGEERGPTSLADGLRPPDAPLRFAPDAPLRCAPVRSRRLRFAAPPDVVAARRRPAPRCAMLPMVRGRGVFIMSLLWPSTAENTGARPRGSWRRRVPIVDGRAAEPRGNGMARGGFVRC